MIHKFLPAWFALAVAISVGACGSEGSTDGEVDTTEHDNWVYFDPYMGNLPLGFALADHSITGGQPWGGVQTGTPDQSWGIDVKAGRHGSSGPADWFRSNASAATCTMDCATSWPSDLNFAITGTITINGTGYSVTIGQGSTGTSNNWWIGGPGWTIHPGVYDNVMTPDGAHVFIPEEDSSDQFWICDSYDSCPP